MISDMLSLLREKNNYTMKDVAEGIGVKPDTYRSYERGRLQPNLEVVCKLADFYGVTTDYLLGREPLDNPFAELHIEVKDRPFLESFQALPDYAKEIFIDAMKKMVEAAEKENRK